MERRAHMCYISSYSAWKSSGSHCLEEPRMLTKYLRAAMAHAKYDILSDDRTFYGEIPGFNGVYANAPSLEACREELEEVLEEWILFRIAKNLPLPVVEGIELTIKEVA